MPTRSSPSAWPPRGAVRLPLRAALARPRRGLAGPDGRADRDQPGARPHRPPHLAGRALAGLPAWPVAFVHSIGIGHRHAARRAARPRRRPAPLAVAAALAWRVPPRGPGRPTASAPPGAGRWPRQQAGWTGSGAEPVPDERRPPGRGGHAAGPPPALPRLLRRRPEPTASLAGHLATARARCRYPARPGGLIAEAEAAGLTGRGGAAFPVHRKLAAVAAPRAPPGRGRGQRGRGRARQRQGRGAAVAGAAPGARRAAARRGGGRGRDGVPVLPPRPRSCTGRWTARWPSGPRPGWTAVQVELMQAPDRFLAGRGTGPGQPASAAARRCPPFTQPPVYERGVPAARPWSRTSRPWPTWP